MMLQRNARAGRFDISHEPMVIAMLSRLARRTSLGRLWRTRTRAGTMETVTTLPRSRCLTPTDPVQPHVTAEEAFTAEAPFLVSITPARLLDRPHARSL